MLKPNTAQDVDFNKYHELLESVKPYLNEENVQNVNRIVLSNRDLKYKLKSMLESFASKRIKKTIPRRSRSLTSLTVNDTLRNRVRWIDQVEENVKESETDSDGNIANQGTSSSENTEDFLRNDFLFGVNQKLKDSESDKQLHLFDRIYSMESKYHSEVSNLQRLYEQELEKLAEKNKIDQAAYKEEVATLKMKFCDEVAAVKNDLKASYENYENLKVDSKNKIDQLEENYSSLGASLKAEYETKVKTILEEKEEELEKLKFLHNSQLKLLEDKFDIKYRDLMEQFEAKSSELLEIQSQLDKERAGTALATERMQHAQTKLQQTNLILDDLHEQYQDAKERWAHLETVNKRMLEQSNAEQEHMRLHYEDRVAQLHDANLNERSEWEETRKNLELKIKECETTLEEYKRQIEKIRSDNDLQLAEYQTSTHKQVLNQQSQILDLFKNDKQKTSSILVGFKNEKGKTLELVQQQGILLEGQFKIVNQSLSDIQKRLKLVQTPSELVKLISSTVRDGLQAHEMSKNMDIVKSLSNQLESLTAEASQMREQCREVERMVKDRDQFIEELKSEHRKELNQLSEKERKLAREFAEEEIAKTRKAMMLERSAQSQTVQELINKMNGKFGKLETEYNRKNNAIEAKLHETKNQLAEAKKVIEEEKARFEAERTNLIKQNEIILSRVQKEYDQHCNSLKESLSRTEKKLLQMERRLMEQERENSNRISKLQTAYSQELSSLMPAETQSHLQNTIASLRAQICILERRLDNQGQHVQHMDSVMLKKENFVDVSTQLTDSKNPFLAVESKVWLNSDQEDLFDPKFNSSTN